MSSPGKAHGVSLPIWAILQRHVSSPAWMSSAELRSGITKLNLELDINVVIVFDKSETKIEMEPLTPEGILVLAELRMRSEFPLCPDGECEYDAAGVCKWCANPHH